MSEILRVLTALRTSTVPGACVRSRSAHTAFHALLVAGFVCNCAQLRRSSATKWPVRPLLIRGTSPIASVRHVSAASLNLHRNYGIKIADPCLASGSIGLETSQSGLSERRTPRRHELLWSLSIGQIGISFSSPLPGFNFLALAAQVVPLFLGGSRRGSYPC